MDNIKNNVVDSEKNHLNESFKSRLERAVRLKDYAISNDLDVSDDTLERISNLLIHETSEINKERYYVLDQCIRDLTEVTYPTTIDTINIEGGEIFWQRKSVFMDFGIYWNFCSRSINILFR